MTGILIAIPKALLFFCHLILGLSLAILLRLLFGNSWYTNRFGAKVKICWTKILALILGLHIKRRGKPTGEPTLMVSNHISWLDIIAIGAHQPCVFIAKNTVQNWPLIGFLASISGTLFVNRQSRRDVCNVMQKGKHVIDEGVSLVFFPEATTTNGKQIKPFRTSFYQTAIDTQSDTQAVAIRYPEKKGETSPAPYIDDDSFVSHLLRILQTGRIDVSLYYCAPIPATHNHDRKVLAKATQNQVTEILALDLVPVEEAA